MFSDKCSVIGLKAFQSGRDRIHMPFFGLVVIMPVWTLNEPGLNVSFSFWSDQENWTTSVNTTYKGRTEESLRKCILQFFQFNLWSTCHTVWIQSTAWVYYMEKKKGYNFREGTTGKLTLCCRGTWRGPPCLVCLLAFEVASQSPLLTRVHS